MIKFPLTVHKAITVTISIWTVSVHQFNQRLDFKSPLSSFKNILLLLLLKKKKTTKMVQLPCPVIFVTRDNVISNQRTHVIRLQWSQIRSLAYQNFPPSMQRLWEKVDWHCKLENIVSFKQLIVSLLKATWVGLTWIDSLSTATGL